MIVYDKEQILDILKQNTTYRDNCWCYNKYINDHGYGQLRVGGRKGKLERVNRLSAWIFLDLDLNDKRLNSLHKLICPNKNCWNPEHLYIGTQKRNNEDAFENGVGRLARHFQKNQILCIRGHELTKRPNGTRFCRECANIRRRKI